MKKVTKHDPGTVRPADLLPDASIPPPRLPNWQVRRPGPARDLHCVRKAGRGRQGPPKGGAARNEADGILGKGEGTVGRRQEAGDRGRDETNPSMRGRKS